MIVPRRGPAALLAALVLVVLALGPSAGPATGQLVADDPVFTGGLQWGLERIGAPAAWTRSTGQGVTIAIVDSGAALDHPDLADQIVGHVSCVGSDGDPRRCTGPGRDDNGHGTHVAGIAAAATGNGRGVAGVAPDARLLVVRSLVNQCNGDRCSATGTAADVAAGIRWAVAQGADVINLSLGGGLLQAALGCAFCDAIEEAWARGVVAVVAAGNDAILPAGFGSTHAVVVTATTRDDGRASYSNSNNSILSAARWPVAAPGGEAENRREDCGTGGRPAGVISTYWTPDQPAGYACLAGTSMAAPHVSGALALLLAAGLGPQQAIDRLLSTAVDLGPSGRDTTFGHGRIDVAAALASTPATTVPPPSTTRPAPTTAPPPPSTTAAPPPATDPEAPADTTPPEEPAPLPEITVPDTSAAAPFTPAPAPGAEPGRAPDEPPGWLVALAIAGVAATATGAAATATRLR